MTNDKKAGASPATSALAPNFPERIFITGASGYVGRNLVRHFVAAGANVIGLSRGESGADLIRELGATPVVGDIVSTDLAGSMKGCDALVHAAANTDHGRSTEAQQRTNREGTRRVFQMARKAGIGRAVHISSESVLADGHPIVNASESRPFPRRPAGGYSRSKAAAEKTALSFNSLELRIMVVRPRFVWGRDDTTALPMLVQAARSGQMAWIDGGTYLTSTTHIANLCLGIDLTLSRGTGGEVYFITDGAPVEFRSFISQILETQGVEVPEKSVPRALLKAIARIGDAVGKISGGRIAAPLTMQSYATSAVEVTLDIGKARTELGYVPVFSREAGLAELREQTVRGRRSE
ncbi:NAD-dependent epimerase/dehydratase family protein [Devosia sp. RR2S18]|uniref:NAD-dependent epimerase/dehydratase family protein n=1 Tax=Devosia rhizosphaerae TaxID=3049774 RepID=UPI0025421F78|nr:NAD-dependent epimerase/dehydratase family protein [Devosia sp. RR2S18]WIJ25845.1 NAD-dependent epimerase/dehydratase family protein [Devosia sp. RR2S18]